MKSSSASNDKYTMWVLMRAIPFSMMEVLNGIPLNTPKEGPQKFMPIFDTKWQAIKFAEEMGWTELNSGLNEIILTKNQTN